MPSTFQLRCLLAVFLSGASALTFEILWQRQMFLIFGASAPATTAVLTAIFLGIAFGSLMATPVTNRFRRPLIVFSVMETTIGVWGFSIPFLLPITNELYLFMALRLGEANPLLSAVRFVLAVGLLLPATLCMGATIPVMVAGLSDHEKTRVSTVYGVNTLGAVLGALLTGLVLIRMLGMSQTRIVAMGLNIAAALCAVQAACRRTDLSTAVPVTPSNSRPLAGASRRLLGVLYFAAGYVALGLEVVWLRLLGIVNTNSTVTFSLTLAVYLLAMGLGSLILFPILHRIMQAKTIFSTGNLAVAAASLLTFPVIYAAPELNYWRIAEPAANGTLTLLDIYSTEALIIGVLMFLPALCMGLIYPAVCHSPDAISAERARWIGTSYFLGTLGAVAGILTVSMWIIPAIGLHAAFALLVMTSAGIGSLSWMTTQTGSKRWLAPGIGIVLSCWAIIIAAEARPTLSEFTSGRTGTRWFEFSVANPDSKVSEIRRFKAGSSGTVIIKKRQGSDDHLVYVDDQLVASTNMEARVDALMLAHLPLMLHPDPADELTVGFGSGGTSHAITTHQVEAFCVEIEPEVPRSAGLLDRQNFGVLSHPRFHLILNDARDHLSIGIQPYDVIATDVTNLQYKQNSSLYTVEYFQLMQRKLRPGGIACAWIPMAAINTDELRILMKSFQHVFPHATLWYMNHTHTNFGILIGTPHDLVMDFQRMQRSFSIPAVAENLKLIGVTNPLQIIHSLHLDEHGYREFCGDVSLHTDNDPVLEFSSPLSFYQYNETFRDNLSATLPFRPQDSRSLVTGLPEEQNAEWEQHRVASQSFCRVMVHFYEFLIHRGRNDRDRAIQSLNEASAFAKVGMNAMPQDPGREQFYVQFFLAAQEWIKSI
ncbi:MAG: fused MFS/spermidine synthase [Planctomycetaceae bacterium]